MEYKFNNFYELIEKNAKKYPKKPAYFEDGKKYNWLEVKKRVDDFANYLASIGIKKNDKVGILLKNSFEFIISMFAIQKIGAIAVPINTFLKQNEIEYILNDVEAKILITSDDFKIDTDINIINAKDIKNLKSNKVETNLPTINDLALIIYTSGTTGRPKGAMLSYKNLFSNILGVNELVKLTQKDRFIAYLPMFHTFSVTVNILLPLYSASAVVIIKSVFPFKNVIKETLLKRVTIFTGIPDVYAALSKAKIPFYFHLFNKVKFYISGSAPLSEEVFKNFSKKFKGELLEGYGLSEASPVVAVNPPKKQKVGSVGLPLPGVEVKIVDENLIEVDDLEEGEIIVRGDNVMQGYYNNKDATERTIINGWLMTGDIGKKDKDGYLYILDRKKDLIISKGINIYPREIEEVCLKFKGVKNCAVVGLKDDLFGEVPIAFLELDEEIDLAKLKEFLKANLANYKIPKKFFIVEELPKNATGKVLKRKLREELNKYMNKGYTYKPGSV